MPDPHPLDKAFAAYEAPLEKSRREGIREALETLRDAVGWREEPRRGGGTLRTHVTTPIPLIHDRIAALLDQPPEGERNA